MTIAELEEYVEELEENIVEKVDQFLESENKTFFELKTELSVLLEDIIDKSVNHDVMERTTNCTARAVFRTFGSVYDVEIYDHERHHIHYRMF